MIRKFLDSLKYLKIKDFVAVFEFFVLLLPALLFKLINKIRKKDIWLICENSDAARDNGYHFFKYIRENHPNVNVYYTIDKISPDYKKVKKYGNIIEYGSIKHWIYYLAATKNISTQKSGNPNPPLFYVLHVYFKLFNNRVYLKHGIVKDDAKYLYYDKTYFRIITCGAKKEYEYIKEKFGYPSENVKYTGLARFDNLYNNKVNKKQILIMPTWRTSLGREKNILSKKENFIDSVYFKSWNSLLNDKKLLNYINKNNITIYFYPHHNMQKYIKCFNIDNENIKVVDNSCIDIQTLLKTSSLLITDYSSVYMDFAYMEKPIIYYQFDYDEYRKNQLNEGYFNYEEDGFGKVLKNKDKVISKIIYYINNSYQIEKKYIKRMKDFYPLHDQNNSKRIYEEIKKW